MMRVLITADTVGGVWTYVADLAAGLRALGVAPIVATLGPAASPAQRAALGGVALIETGLPLDWLAADEAAIRAAGRDLAALARAVEADLVQLNAPAFAAGAPFDRPVLAVAHSCVGSWWRAVRQGPLPADLGWRAALTAQGLAAADQVVVPSKSFAAALAQTYAFTVPPRIVPNGRRAAALPPAPPVAHGFTAGRLWDEGKNAATLDRAAAIAATPIRAAGAFAGPRGDRVTLDRLVPLGPLPPAAIAAELAGRPVFLSAAVYEPFGLAVLEAAQAGCALILSDIPVFRELWDGAARFVYPHDAAGFARALDGLIADPALRGQLGAAARRRAGRFTVAAMAAAMLGQYRALLSPAAPVAARAARALVEVAA